MKVLQVVIFFAVVGWCIYATQNDAALPKNGLAFIVLAVFVVTVATVIPWLIFKMIEQAISDWRSQSRRVDSSALKLPDNGVSRGTPRDRITRIGK